MLKQSLSPSEILLLEIYNYMSTRAKRGRPVPMIYSEDTKLALDALVQHRVTCGISDSNIRK